MESDDSSFKNRFTPSQWIVVAVIVAFAVGKLLYALLLSNDLEQTSALFIGLPAILAILLTLTPRAKSLYGVVFKGITIALLLSTVVLHEGFLCILLAAPLFYGVGAVAAWSRTPSKWLDGRRRGLVLLPLMMLSLEGTLPALSINRDEVSVAERVVKGSPEDVETVLGQTPAFNKTLPWFLQAGWPRPDATGGSGLSVGDRRVIHFNGSAGQFLGEGIPGDLTLEVSERRPGLVRFKVVSDQSHLPHWLEWKESEVRWKAVGEGRTEVRWTLSWERRLDPSWYFGPIERYAVGLATGYLLDNLATP